MMSEDLMIRNARLWPSADCEVIEDASLLIRNGRIVKAGRFHARAETVLDAGGGVVMPGLIQSHVHLCQTLFRGIAEDLPLLPWLRGYIWPMEAAHDEESIRASALLTCAEFLRGGTTAFMSMETVRHTHAVFEAVDEAGLAGVIGHCLMDETGGYDPLSVPPERSLDECDALLDDYRDHPRLRPAVAPRFALSCSEPNMAMAADYARDRKLRLHTHASEQVEETSLVREMTGRDNIRFLSDVGLTGPDVGLAHCVHTEEHERALLEETGTHVLHCPSANLKLGSGIAPIPEYLDRGISVSLGADGAPCNNRMDMFLEMREAGLIQKPRLGPDALAARDVVRMATEGGAAALGLSGEMGRLEPGYRANLIILEADTASVAPCADPATNAVYGHAASDVALTMVDGRVLYENGEITAFDEEAVLREARTQRRRLEERAGLR